MSGLVRTRTAISKADMEASRLVFVFVRDAKPKRKVAVPVPDGYTWEDFLQQVKNKLKISGIREVFLASSGQTVSALDELQDIDELCVVEGQDTPYTNGVAPVALEAALRGGMTASTSEPTVPDGEAFRQQAHPPDKHKIAVDGVASSTAARQRVEDESKYIKRTNPLKRLLQRVLPASFFMPGLPISSKDLTAEDRTASTGILRRRRRRSPLTLQNFLLVIVILSFIGSTLYYVFRINVPTA